MELKTLLLPTESPLPDAPVRPAGRDASSSGERARGTMGPSSEERELIARSVGGDRAAMRVLYERYSRRVFSLTSRIAGAQDAEELTQEVFLKAFRALDKFRGDAQLGTWLYRMAVNAALSHVSRSKTRRNLPDEHLAEVPAPTSGGDGDPRVRLRLERALAELPPGYRAVIVLHDVEGLEHEEIAGVLGCSVGTSKSQLHKARARMRELLGPQLASERRGGQR